MWFDFTIGTRFNILVGLRFPYQIATHVLVKWYLWSEVYDTPYDDIDIHLSHRKYKDYVYRKMLVQEYLKK